MAEVTPVQSKDNSTLYATAAAAGAGAALGGVGGYMRKPYLNDGNLTDEFIKVAEENLSDEAKQVMANKSKLIANEAAYWESIKKIQNAELSDEGLLKEIQADAKTKIEVMESIPEKIKNTTSINDFIADIAKQDSDIARLCYLGIEEDKKELLANIVTEIKDKHAYDWSTDLLRNSEIAQTPEELLAVVKPYDAEIAEKITKTFGQDNLLKELHSQADLIARDMHEDIKTLKQIAEAKSFEELKNIANNIPEDSAIGILYRINGDLPTINMTAGERFATVKDIAISRLEELGIDAKIGEKIAAAKDKNEFNQIMENIFKERISNERRSLISGCWDSAKKEFVNTENALGESVKKTASSMKTRLALMYGAIGAAVLGLGTYLFMSSKKAPAEAAKNVDEKA